MKSRFISKKLLSGLLIPILTLPCMATPMGISANATVSPVLTCTPADDWTALFDRKGTKGWLAADGIYSVALSGNDALSGADDTTKTLFFFSDTILGQANSSGKISRYYGMANHTAALLIGDQPDPSQISFYYGLKGNLDTSGNLNLFEQNQWLFDCFVVGNKVYALAFSQQDWKPAQIDLISIPISAEGEPRFDKYKRTRNVKPLLKKLPDFDYAYGMGVLSNTESAGAPDPDGYIYIYGYRDNFAAFSQKDLIVSRIHEDDFPDFSKLRYWNGSDWCEDIEQSAILIERVSCEVSVSPITVGPYKGKYIAVYNQDVQSNRIMYAIGDSPVGPFDKSVHCYTIPETGLPAAGGTGTLYTYNAKAHPHISPAGTLLISYNVNVNGAPMAQNTADYRPRFLSLDLQATAEEIEALNKPIAGDETTDSAPTQPPVTTNPTGDATTPSSKPAWVPIAIGATAAVAVLGTACGVFIGLRTKRNKNR